MPIGLSFATAGFLGFALVRDLDPALNLLSVIPYTWASTYTLIVAPLFILMGQFAFHSGISKDLYNTAYKWVGKQPGGLALATTIACTGFAACTGSSLASAATMGTLSIPEMRRFHYDPRLATGCVAAGGTLGVLVPPSIIFILYGLLTESSIGQLFIAGILPGLLLSILFLILISVMCRINPQFGPRGPSFSWRERFNSLGGVWGMLGLFVTVIGGIYAGIFTPTEAGAIGAFGAFIISLVRRRLTWVIIIAVIKDTVRTTGMIFMILIGAQIFNTFLALSGIPSMIAQGIGSLQFSPLAILMIVLSIYIPLGMVMDSLPMILLTLPTMFPIVANLGFNPIWFGVLVCVMCELANISPPMGMNLYIVRGVARDVPLEKIIIGIVPFAIMMIVCIAILIAFPQISLFLPNLMKV
jgi:tripartite ATP-independent transporter DctM subunit